jgi:hypothetical protein
MTRRALFVQLSVGLLAVLTAFGAGSLRGQTRRNESGLPGSSLYIAPKTTLTPPETKPLSPEWRPIAEKYAGGVCLLTVRVMFVDGKGNPFRYNSRIYSARGELALDPDGEVYDLVFFGTGFHIGDGVVLSHVRLFVLKSGGSLVTGGENGEPVFLDGVEYHRVLFDVTATFPNHEKAFSMRTNGYRLVHGVPEFTFDLGGADVPALPIQEEKARESISEEGIFREGASFLMLGVADPSYQKSPEDRKTLSAAVAEVEKSGELRFPGTSNNFQQMNPGFPIFNREGVVVGIFGRRLFSHQGVVIPEKISTNELELLGAGYGPHRAKEKRGLACDKCGPASGTDKHRP